MGRCRIISRKRKCPKPGKCKKMGRRKNANKIYCP